MRKVIYEILTGATGTTYQIPIFLENSVDEMGIMVGFDGNIEQVEQFCNFTYKGMGGNTIRVYNTLNTNKFKALIDSVFTVSWGDGNYSGITMTTVYDQNLNYSDHTYTVSGSTYDIEITVNSPWKIEKLKRSIYIPITGSTFPTDLGTLTFTIPYSNPPISGITQEYLEDYRTLTGNTSGATISFIALGKSRIDEFKSYGSSSIYSGVTTGHTDAGDYTGYTIDGLFYMDYSDGYTHITGNTSSYYTDELYQGMITRNEHLIGFMDTPQIFSDIFVERGKQGVMERNLRLGEIDSVGELDIYGSGFFKVKKQ
jgi:hypothetical protein